MRPRHYTTNDPTVQERRQGLMQDANPYAPSTRSNKFKGTSPVCYGMHTLTQHYIQIKNAHTHSFLVARLGLHLGIRAVLGRLGCYGLFLLLFVTLRLNRSSLGLRCATYFAKSATEKEAEYFQGKPN